jgi:hypothetical protein
VPEPDDGARQACQELCVLPSDPRDPELVVPGLLSVDDPPGWAYPWTLSAARWPVPFDDDDLDEPYPWWLQAGADAAELFDEDEVTIGA